MLILLLQIVGMLMLFAGIAAGYWYWVRPRADLSGPARRMLVLIIVTGMGGWIGAGPWWFDAPWSFSWDLPPLAGRMLGAAAWSFVVVCFMALQRPSRPRARLVLLLLAVYLTPLALAIVLFHRDRFDIASPVTYVFFGIVLPMVASSLWYLWRQPAALPAGDEEHERPAAPVAGWLALLALGCGLWGAALFATDAGPLDWVWVWPGDLLSSRLIAVMLLAIASGAAYGRRYAATGRMMLAMTTVYGSGLAVASLWNALGGKPIKLAYLVVFGVVALVSGTLLAREWRAGRLARPGLRAVAK